MISRIAGPETFTRLSSCLPLRLLRIFAILPAITRPRDQQYWLIYAEFYPLFNEQEFHGRTAACQER
jgi:hypothetical protein